MSTEITGTDLLNGRDPLPDVIELKAGPLTGVFDPHIGFLRQVRLGDHELIRGLYMAVRDKGWKTVPIDLTITRQDLSDTQFHLEFDVLAQRGDIDFRWKGTLTGNLDGRITYAFEGQAHSDFLRMRIGFCLLHAENECAGKSVIRTTPDGLSDTLIFPATIHPEEPVKDIRSLEYEAAPGVQVRFTFEGDTFEMEDQRNWTDASFKTYSTPASLPRPVQVKSGDRISQSVTLDFPSEPRKIFPVLIGREPQFNISTTPVFTIPPIGFNVSPLQPEPTGESLERLKALHPAHIRADILPESDHWSAHLGKAANVAASCQSRLHLAITDPDPSDDWLNQLADTCKNIGMSPSVLQFIGWRGKVLTDETISRVTSTAARLFPGASLGVGSDKDYAQVNTNRQLAGSKLHPVYGICPQVHAFDDLSLIENITGQLRTVESVKTWWPQTPMIASVHLHRYPGTKALYDMATESLEWDSRHPSLFAAGWTLGSLTKLITSGHTHSLTYFEVTGPRGLMAPESENVSNENPLPDGFRGIPGCVYPLYFIFLSMAGATRALRTHSSHPWETESVTLLRPDGKRTLITANLTHRSLPVKIKSGTCSAKIKVLDATNVCEAIHDPLNFLDHNPSTIDARGGKLHLDLGPNAIAFLDEV